MLGKNHYPASGLQPFDRFPDSGLQPCVMVYRNGVGIVEDQQSERGNDMAEHPVEPSDAPRLLRPEVPVGVCCHFLTVHHLPGTPYVMQSRGIQLTCDRSVHMAVVSHYNALSLGKIFGSRKPVFRREEPYEPSYYPVQSVYKACFRVVHFRAFAVLCDHYAGNSAFTVRDAPSSENAWIFPLCASVTALATASPSPKPPDSEFLEVSAR